MPSICLLVALAHLPVSTEEIRKSKGKKQLPVRAAPFCHCVLSVLVSLCTKDLFHAIRYVHALLLVMLLFPDG